MAREWGWNAAEARNALSSVVLRPESRLKGADGKFSLARIYAEAKQALNRKELRLYAYWKDPLFAGTGEEALFRQGLLQIFQILPQGLAANVTALIAQELKAEQVYQQQQ